MTSNQLTLPAFPLKTILLPGEATKLHIFEDRYKELVQDCLDNDASFAIPFFENGKMSNYGCEVKIKNVVKEYADGKKDILIECVRILTIIEYSETLSPKLYGAVLIEFEKENTVITNSNLQDAIIHYFSTVQNKMIDYDTLSKLSVYNIAASLQLTAQEKLELVASHNKQAVLLNQIKFITHIVNAEQQLNNKFMFN
ncbi:MAG: LON peptidase substrate-binding domain-containing protein [Bacteroidota bacterium]|nr:LON peptidase substrate-binding domain-containing protein [Bacteroidota bacterium]